MNKVLELKEQREALTQELQGLVATSEGREFTDDEATQFDAKEAQIKDLNKRIESEERKAKYRKVARDKKVVTPEAEAKRDYSVAKAISESLSGKLTGLEAEMDVEARKSGMHFDGFGIPSMLVQERTTLTAGTAATAGNLIETSLSNNLIKSLQPNPVMFQAGATVFSGLQGNVDIPRETAAVSATWEGETDASAESNPTYDKLSLSPNRLGAHTIISKQLLLQNRFIADAEIAQLIREATARKLDATIINGQDSGTDPFDGILNLTGIGDVAGGTNGANPTWANIVGLESEVATDNALMGSLFYLTTPGVRGYLKTKAKDAGSGLFVVEGDSTNGYPVFTSTQVPSTLNKGTSTGVCHAIIYGNASDVVVGNWGGYDIVVDPYTGASTTTVKIYVNSWWDVVYRHAESFAAMKDALIS